MNRNLQFMGSVGFFWGGEGEEVDKESWWIWLLKPRDQHPLPSSLLSPPQPFFQVHSACKNSCALFAGKVTAKGHGWEPGCFSAELQGGEGRLRNSIRSFSSLARRLEPRLRLFRPAPARPGCRRWRIPQASLEEPGEPGLPAGLCSPPWLLFRHHIPLGDVPCPFPGALLRAGTAHGLRKGACTARPAPAAPLSPSVTLCHPLSPRDARGIPSQQLINSPRPDLSRGGGGPGRGKHTGYLKYCRMSPKGNLCPKIVTQFPWLGLCPRQIHSAAPHDFLSCLQDRQPSAVKGLKEHLHGQSCCSGLCAGAPPPAHLTCKLLSGSWPKFSAHKRATKAARQTLKCPALKSAPIVSGSWVLTNVGIP